MKLNKIMASVLSVSLVFSAMCFDVSAASEKGIQKSRHKIQLRATTFESDDSSFEARFNATKAGSKKARPYIISFTGPITEDMKNSVKSVGANLLDYIPDFSFMTFITPDRYSFG